MPTTSAGLFHDYLPAPQICKPFSAPPAFCETRPEHFDRALADGKVSTNVYLRRIHMRNTRKSPCRRWMNGKRNGRRIHNATCNQSCCHGFPVAVGCHGAIELTLQ